MGEQRLVILPSFYQTWWFYTVSVVLLSMALWSLHRLRLRRVTARIGIRRHERDKVAQDLHDTLLQTVHTLLIHVQRSARAIPSGEPAQELLKESATIAQLAIDEARDRIVSLQSFEGAADDFSAAMNEIGRHLEAIHRKKFSLITIGDRRVIARSLGNELADIVREALLNAFRHSAGTSVKLTVVYTPDELKIVVDDDGIGIDPIVVASGGLPGHWGLATMRSRARAIGATTTWQSDASGTRFECCVQTHFRWSRVLARFRRVRQYFASLFYKR